jgi:hypothetical protein
MTPRLNVCLQDWSERARPDIAHLWRSFGKTATSSIVPLCLLASPQLRAIRTFRLKPVSVELPRGSAQVLECNCEEEPCPRRGGVSTCTTADLHTTADGHNLVTSTIGSSTFTVPASSPLSYTSVFLEAELILTNYHTG